jgi:hypothetical protein
MRKIPKAIYQTPSQIDQRIKELEADAASLPPGESRQAVLREIAQLKVYADAKRWTESPRLKHGT